ncbi:MAG: universal stress protein [Reichenbachiella sp.]|uniref:universal stress protein n=1 Tax=Reichenbachiella sp. TaxID=2184521 RepID=UPI0032666343
MKSIQNILVPYDFSPESKIGLKAACSLALRFKSRIHLVQNVKPKESQVPLHKKDAMLDSTNTLHHLQLEKQVNKASVDLRKVLDEFVTKAMQGITHTTSGSFTMLLDEMSKKVDVDLVVTGTDGSRSFLEFFVGNDTEGIIRNADVPVIAVSDHEEIVFDNILIATDLGKAIPDRIFELSRFLQEQGAALHFVNIITTEIITTEEVEQKVRAIAKINNINNYTTHIRHHSSEIEGIQRVAKKIDADLILMKTYEKSKFSGFIEGSLAERMVRESNIPVMVENVSKKKGI